MGHSRLGYRRFAAATVAAIFVAAAFGAAAVANPTPAPRGGDSSGPRIDDVLQRYFGAAMPARPSVFGPAVSTAADEVFWDGMDPCGDGAVDSPGEQCDRGDFAGATCLTYGYTMGTLSCDRTCHVDISQCSGACPVVCVTDGDCGPCGPCILFGGPPGVCSL